MTHTERAWQRLDKMLELYRAYQEKIQVQQRAIAFLDERGTFEPGVPGMDASADDLISLMELAEATVELNNRWITYGEHKCGLDVKPKDRSHLKVVD